MRKNSCLMRKTLFAVLFSYLFASGISLANEAISACYKDVAKKEDLRECLTLEVKEVQSQYNSVLERVMAKAKNFDRTNKKRETVQDLTEANRSFNSFMKSACEFRGAIKAADAGEAEAILACRINFMRARMNALEVDYLSED